MARVERGGSLRDVYYVPVASARFAYRQGVRIGTGTVAVQLKRIARQAIAEAHGLPMSKLSCKVDVVAGVFEVSKKRDL